MTDTNYSSRSSLQDLENKLEIDHHGPNKRKLWIWVAGIVLLISVTIVAIAVPVSIHRKHSEQDANLSASTATHTKAIQQTIAVTTSSILNQIHQSEKIKADSSSAVSLITADQSLINPPDYSHTISPYANLTRLKTYTPPAQARVFVMGDIHGCLNEMNRLLDVIGFNMQNDVLILTGDLVFRGPDSIGVIRRAKELNALCVRGNHDDKVIRLKGYMDKFGIDSMSPKDEIMPEGQVGDPLKFGNKHIKIARRMNVDDYNYLAGCPLMLDIPTLEARVVHGGLDPYISLLDNDPWSVMNMRDMDSDHHPSKAKLSKNSPSSDNVHWTTAYHSYITNDRTVFYGHDASRGIDLDSKTIGLDSGCVYGRKLSAIEINTRKLYQIDCRGEDDEKDDD
ncbi:Metallo-dependent phosphatase-like protein [Helicostylum pulchrum]|nr:Metallo-dependent phosphatase-like protein [Helicostylum pulchrum]